MQHASNNHWDEIIKTFSGLSLQDKGKRFASILFEVSRAIADDILLRNDVEPGLKRMLRAAQGGEGHTQPIVIATIGYMLYLIGQQFSSRQQGIRDQFIHDIIEGVRGILTNDFGYSSGDVEKATQEFHDSMLVYSQPSDRLFGGNGASEYGKRVATAISLGRNAILMTAISICFASRWVTIRDLPNEIINI